MQFKKKNGNAGSLTAEASVVLIVFVSAFCLFYSYINSIMIQRDIQNALNKACSDVAGYCYDASVVMDCTSTVLNKISDKNDGETDALIPFLASKSQTVLSFLRGNRENFDPEAVASDFLSGLGNELSGQVDGKILETSLGEYGGKATEALRVLLSGLISDTVSDFAASKTGEGLCKLTLPGYLGEDADLRLKNAGIEGGLCGIDYTGSEVLPDGSDIVLCVNYKIKAFPGSLLTFTTSVTQRATVSSLCIKQEQDSRSVWTYSNTIRGKKILKTVKDENVLSAVASGYIFDLYNHNTQEYTLVFSVNLFAKTYSSCSASTDTEKQDATNYTLNTTAVEKLLTEKVTEIKKSISKRSEGETINRYLGGTVQIKKSNAKMRILAVIPEEASVFLADLEKTAAQLEKNYGVIFEFKRMDKAL